MADANARAIDDIKARSHPRQEVRSAGMVGAAGNAPTLAEIAPSHVPTLAGTLQGGRGNAPSRSAAMQHAQKVHGNRAVQRVVQRMSMAAGTISAQGDPLAQLEALPGRDSSAQLGGGVRTFLEQGLGSDLSGVRVHADNQADQLARSMDALAFTTGQDIFFRSGAYKPGSADGLRLLAHEATHAVQQEHTGQQAGESDADTVQPAPIVSQRTDPSEIEAERAADSTMAGERAEVSTRPGAIVSRFGWQDALAMGGGGVIGEVASAFMGPSPDPAAAAAPSGAGTPTAPPKDEGMWDKLKRGWSGEVKQEQKRSEEIDSARHDSIDNTVDWLEGQAHKGNQAGVDATKDIPVLHQLAQANAAVGDFGADFAGGFVKGAGGFLGSIGQMAANPIGTAKGLWAMSTHIPGLGLPSKIIDKGIDVATGDKKLGDAFDETLGGKAATDDLDFWKGVGGHFLKPYGEAVDKGKYGEVGGRALFDIGSLVLGAGEAKAGVVSDAAKSGDAANAATKVVDAAEGANAIPKSVPPPSGVPTLRNPTPAFEPPPGSVPPSPLVPSVPPPAEIPPPVPSQGPPTLQSPPTNIPLAPKTIPVARPPVMPEGPPLPAPSRPAPSTIPSPPENLPTTHPLSPGELQNPVIPPHPEPPGWAEGLLDEERLEELLIEGLEERKNKL